ncbi:MAG: SCO family protein, partial [Pseudobdellovibrionaceae bacterium]
VKRMIRWVAIGLLIAAVSTVAAAYDGKPASLPAQDVPEEFKGVGIDEKLGVSLDKTLPVVNEKGETVPLGTYFDKHRPVILSLVYFSCPGLCNYHLNGLNDGMKELDWSIGKEFTVISLSFDPKETFETAAAKKETYLKVYGRKDAEKDWHFLTAKADTIKKITEATGFKYKWIEEAKEWSHGSAAIMLTPEGKISRYLPGVMFEKKDLRLALTEASDGKVGNFVDHFVMTCFRWDPKQSKFTLYGFRLVQAGSGVTVLLLGLWLIPFWIRSIRKNNRKARS